MPHDKDKEITETGTGVLMPPARLSIFAPDKKTCALAESLAQDWRFARVEADSTEGDIDTAIARYREQPSPDLLVIRTEKLDDSFTAKLEELAGLCGEGTAAMVIGPVNDVNLYRNMIAMGISDYLVHPVKPENFNEDVARTLLNRMGTGGSRLIALIGAKGGVGTSVLSEALAWGIADTLNEKTVLMDAAGGWSYLSMAMGTEPATTLHEAVRAALQNEEDALQRMLYAASSKLHVLASGGDVLLEEAADAESLENLVDVLMAKFPALVVDLSSSTPALRRTVLTRAHEITVISTPMLSSLRPARTLLQEIKELRGGTDEETDLVVNMQGLVPAHEVAVRDLEQAIERKISAIIPFDPKLFVGAESQGKKLSAEKGGAKIVESLLPLARKVLKKEPEAAKPEGFLSKILGKG